MKQQVSIYVLIFIFLAACEQQFGEQNSILQGESLIPVEEVFDGGPGRDGIPSLLNPELINANEADFITDDELVVGLKTENLIRAYPHKILDWHEIINDDLNDIAVAITYCPLTGTAIGWDRVIEGEKTTFGVSGLLYNTNLMPFDRKTDSFWSQMRLDCVNGNLIRNKALTHPLVETSWGTWKKMYPNTKIVSTNTGFDRNYQRYPYQQGSADYRVDNAFFLFPFTPVDNRLPSKERVLGVIINGLAKVYRFDSFAGSQIIEDSFMGKSLVLVGSDINNYIIAFESQLDDGTTLSFSALPPEELPLVMQDNEGNKWDAFGEAQFGPRTGQRLKNTESFIGFWFSWASFYPNPEIFSL